MERIGDFLTNRYTLAYTAAILLHLLLFVFYVPVKQVLTEYENAPPERPESEPLKFEFVEAPEQEAEPAPPENTPMAADRNSRARDRADRALPESHLPYSEGQANTRDVRKTSPGRNGEAGRAGRSASEDAGAVEPEETASKRAERATDFAAALKEPAKENPRQRQEALYGRPSVPPSLQMQNMQSQALERGGLQLSTYEWDFAPYLAYLRRHIGSNIYPPALFTEYGLIEGQTVLRFKIMRDGTLKDLEVLGYKGSRDLRNTSFKAVELSADFRPLPENFPDPYLEVTGVFEYTILRNLR